MAESAGPRVTQLRGTSDQLLLAIQTVALLEQQKRGLPSGTIVSRAWPRPCAKPPRLSWTSRSLRRPRPPASMRRRPSTRTGLTRSPPRSRRGRWPGPGRVASRRASSRRGTGRQRGGDRAARSVRALARPLRRHPGRRDPKAEGSGSGHLICPCHARGCGPDGPRKAAAHRLRSRRRRTFSNPDERPGPGSDPAREPGPFMSGPRHIPATGRPALGLHLRTGLVHLCHPHERGDGHGRAETKKRNAEPKSDFGLPDEKKYPMPDKSHARNAKARASQQVKKGNLTASEKKKIDSKADRDPGQVGASTMPQKEHLPSVSAKEQRMYEHVKESKRIRAARRSARRPSPLPRS